MGSKDLREPYAPVSGKVFIDRDSERDDDIVLPLSSSSSSDNE